MTTFTILNVSGVERRGDIHAINDRFPDDFFKLTEEHIVRGDWFLAYQDGDDEIAGFAGVVPFVPFGGFGYLKRTGVLAEHRGNGLQWQMIGRVMEHAKEAGVYHTLVSSTDIRNVASSNSFIKAGWRLTMPEKPWEKDSNFWVHKVEQ